MLATLIPPAWVPWAACLWAALLNTVAVFSVARSRYVRRYLALYGAITFWSWLWLLPLSARTFGLLTRQEYLDTVAPIAPLVFAVGPWALPALAHLLNERDRRCRERQ